MFKSTKGMANTKWFIIAKINNMYYEFQNYALVTDCDERIKNSVNENLIFVYK